MISIRHRAAEQVLDYNEEELHRIVHTIEQCGINFVAIDFDKTLVSIHTFGTWPGSAPDLSTKVRSFFREFVPLIMARDISVAIVTFSAQVNLIKQVIHIIFPDLAAKIPVRGHDQSWVYQGEGATDGKQKHMASAAEDINIMYVNENKANGHASAHRHSDGSARLGKSRGSGGGNIYLTDVDAGSLEPYGEGEGGGRITRATTLLIDDDSNNIHAALRNKTRAVHCDPENHRNMIEDLLSLQ
jgi:hypothetical protein